MWFWIKQDRLMLLMKFGGRAPLTHWEMRPIEISLRNQAPPRGLRDQLESLRPSGRGKLTRKRPAALVTPFVSWARNTPLYGKEKGSRRSLDVFYQINAELLCAYPNKALRIRQCQELPQYLLSSTMWNPYLLLFSLQCDGYCCSLVFV